MDVNNKVREIKLVKDNYDAILVDVNDVKDLFIGDVTANWTLVDDKKHKLLFAESIYMKIGHNGNKKYKPFNDFNPTEEVIDLEELVFDSIMEKDISVIELIGEDGLIDEYHVSWWTDEDSTLWQPKNAWQHTRLDENGDLCIAIGQYANIEKYFHINKKVGEE